MKISYKIAEATDAEILMQFMQEYCAFDHLPFEEQTRRASVAKLSGEASLGRLWLILCDGQPVGYLVLTLGFSFEYGGYDAFIDEVYLRDECRGAGIGRQALAFAEEECRALGVRALHLEVERENVNARALYRKVGFVEHDRYLLTKTISAKL
ncbi:MAG: GNAT family N-acetyltransferase [Deltaproteobacteria bacterium]|nr:GNAT family N-acetyltransferase [Deltaproteobacteria bacterium]